MKKLVTIGLLAAASVLSFSATAYESVSANAVVTSIPGGLPYSLEQGGEYTQSPTSNSYLWKQPVQVDFGGRFEKHGLLCITMKGVPDTKFYHRGYYLNLQAENGHESHFTQFGSWNTGKEDEHCTRYPYFESMGSNMNLMLSISGGKTEFDSEVLHVDQIVFTLKGFNWIPDETTPISNCAAGEVYVDAIKHAVSPLSVDGDYLTCDVDPNVTYEMTLESPILDAMHDEQGGKSFKNVGLTYNNERGERVITSIVQNEKTYVTTDGLVSFFYADSNENNAGGVSVKFKRTNLD
nr:conserved exported hypothetical protein [Vibrio chagasii]